MLHLMNHGTNKYRHRDRRKQPIPVITETP
jgi:hypothetical protein